MPPRRNTKRRRPMADTRRRKRVVHRFKDDEYVDYKDIALLRKFMSERGKIRSRRVTGLTAKQQREVATAIKNAREMGLLPYIQVRS